MSECFVSGGAANIDVINDQASQFSGNARKTEWAFAESETNMGSATYLPAGTQTTLFCHIRQNSGMSTTEKSKFEIDWLVVRYNYKFTHDIRALLYPEKTVECNVIGGGKIALTLTTSGLYWVVRVDVTAGASSALTCYSKLSAAIGSVRDA